MTPSAIAAVVLAVTLVAAGCSRPASDMEGPSGFASRTEAPAARNPGASKRPNILLITIDTLRPDALGWIGGTNATPVLDALAEGGVAFPSAVSPVPLTLPSHTSMFSGLVPRRHGVRDNHQVVGTSPPLLTERLAAAGYDTAAVVSGFPLSASFGLDRGFARYSDEFTAGDGAWLERPAGEVSAAARAIVSELRAPWYLWVHFYDPHYPYEPPEGFGGAGFRTAYDGEVTYTDAEIGKLLETARTSSDRELLTVFTGDHGEALGEHGESTHGFFIYDDTMLVPLVFHWPGRLAASKPNERARPAGRSEPVRLVDLAPTLIDLLDLEPLPETDGISLRRLLDGDALAIPAAYLETRQPWNSYGWAPLTAIRHEDWKLIVAPDPELFDLVSDPEERNNLYESHRERARELQSQLREAESRAEARAEAIEDPATLEQLRALAYLGASRQEEIPPLDTLRDPKDQVELREILTEADESLRRQEFQTAERLCRQALAKDPANRFARLRLGLALRGSGDLAGAVREFAESVKASPDDPEAAAAYAEALTESGRAADAIAPWMEVVRIQPRRVAAWSNLGAVLGLSGQPEHAVAAYEKAAELEPKNPERWIRLGFAAFGAGDLPRAAEALEHAAELTSAEAFSHPGALGMILLKMGRNSQAESWLERSGPAEGDFPSAVIALAQIRLEQGRAAEAQRLLEAGSRARPEVRALVERDLPGVLATGVSPSPSSPAGPGRPPAGPP